MGQHTHPGCERPKQGDCPEETNWVEKRRFRWYFANGLLRSGDDKPFGQDFSATAGVDETPILCSRCVATATNGVHAGPWQCFSLRVKNGWGWGGISEGNNGERGDYFPQAKSEDCRPHSFAKGKLSMRLLCRLVPLLLTVGLLCQLINCLFDCCWRLLIVRYL